MRSVSGTSQEHRKQIVANVHHQLVAPQPGLVGYWTFGEGTGQIAHDTSGNANHARLGDNTAPTGDEADPTWLDAGPPIHINDCNGNGTLDVCDIADGVSEDCNENDVPDECDISDGRIMRYRVRAFLDDHDHLIIVDNTVQWHHLPGGHRPGQHPNGNGNEPTILGDVEWYPEWNGDWSSIHTGYPMDLNTIVADVTLVAIDARDVLTIYE